MTDKELENRNEARHAQSVLWREQKVGKNRFLQWFYLGRKKKYKTYGKTLFDTVRYKAFAKWVKKAEKHGITIKRNYFFNGETNFSLWNDKKSIGKKVCLWDYGDLINFLIVKLTLQGMYHALFGHTINYKDAMHRCWFVRRELVKAFFAEEKLFFCLKNEVKEKFGIEYKYDFLEEKNPKEVKDFYSMRFTTCFKNFNQEQIMKDAFSLLGENLIYLWD